MSRRSGLVSQVDVRRNSALAFGLTLATARPAAYERLPAGRPIAISGGVGLSEDQARLPALMESIERYCGLFGGLEAEITGPARDLSYVHGERLRLMADWQFDQPGFPLRRHDPDAAVRWCSGRSLYGGRQRRVPSMWIRVPFGAPLPAERSYCSNSSGMAAAFDPGHAVIAALLELCERDAFLVAWYHRLSRPCIEVDLDGLLTPDIARNVREMAAQVHFVDLTNDLGVPVALCVLQRDWQGRPLVSLGLAARPSLLAACRKAFFEAAAESCRVIHELLPLEACWQPAAGFANVNGFEIRPLLYQRPPYQAQLAFLWASPHRRQVARQPALPEPGRALLRELLRRLRPHVDDVIAVPLGTAEARAFGVSVVKVVAPGLVSLYADHAVPHLGSTRIWTAARALGADVDPRFRQVPNELPHPLA